METVACVPTTTNQDIPPVPVKRVYKKRKQTNEDKRKRNYIAVRKHRQQLKDTLENSPVELVRLKKRAEYLDMLLSLKGKMLDECRHFAKIIEKRKQLPEEELKKLTITEKAKSPKPEIASPSPSTISTVTTSTTSTTTAVVPQRRKSTTSPIAEKRRRTTTPVSIPQTSASLPQMFVPPLFSFPPLQRESFQLPFVPEMPSFLLPEPPSLPIPQMPLSPLFSPLYAPPNLFNFGFPFSQPMSFPTTQVATSSAQPAMSQDTIEALWRLCNQGLNS